mmetsp:Transcript_6211/g.12908  ORF Transcript_6211/g.12908 Transcript_6211/m.12908 type:complete len:647 (+) Transcript_6211:64-2004(+)
MQKPRDTIEPRVKFKDGERRYTDVPCAICFLLGIGLFFALGFAVVGSATITFITSDDGTLTLSDELTVDATTCCQSASDWLAEQGASDTTPASFGLCEYVSTGRMRHLTQTNGKFPKDGSLFDAFTLNPQIPATLISAALFLAVFWVVMLRAFATPIVFFTEFLKIVAFVWIAIETPDDNSKVIFFIVALLYLGFIVWKKDKLIFAGKIISHSALALQENTNMFFGLLVIKACYVLQAYCFILFMSKSVEVKEVEMMKTPAGQYTDVDGTVYSYDASAYCYLNEPSWVGQSRQVIMFLWLWSVQWYTQARLCTVAATIGSWHFHPDDKPTAIQAVKNTVTKSLGTVSFSAMILAIIEEIKRRLKFKWYHHCGPQCCITAPMHLLSCLLMMVLENCFKMLTKFTLIIHTFSGLNFFGSAKKCFGVMTRHFENGFITDYASNAVLQLGAYIFSLAITFTAWAWLDEQYGWSTLPSIDNDNNIVIFYLWLFYILFNLWYPVLAVFGIIVADMVITKYASDEHGECGQEHWVAPIAATFVGVISMLFFQYMAGIILDTIDTCFVCWAVDKDNNVDLSESEFSALVMELPGIVKEPNPTSSLDPNATLLAIGPDGRPAQTQPVAVGYAVPQQQGYGGGVQMGQTPPYNNKI